MFADARDVSELGPETLRELVGWRPAHGVLSVYLSADPADRGGGWKIALRNGLRDARESAAHIGHEERYALHRTAERLEREVENYGEAPPRGFVSFVEIAEQGGRQRSFAAQMPPPETGAHRGRRPWLGPLVALLEEGAPIGVAAVSAERVRLLDWRFGRVEELHDWQLELYLDGWRERKAQRPRDPASGQAISASGHDQHDQRMEANRDRFAHDTGALAQAEARERGWKQVLTFGERRYSDRFAEGLGEACEARFVEDADVVSQPLDRIDRRLSGALAELRRERERRLIERIDERAYAEGRASFGRPATMQALEQGRVEHLVYDGRRDGVEVEQMIELAVPTGAAITPVTGDAAGDLEAHDGIAALLRY